VKRELISSRRGGLCKRFLASKIAMRLGIYLQLRGKKSSGREGAQTTELSCEGKGREGSLEVMGG